MGAQLTAAFVWVLAGCSLVVSGEPTIVCKGDLGCPTNQRCAVDLGTCIDASQACTDDSCATDQHCDTGSLRCLSNDTPDLDAGELDATDDQPDATQPPGDADATTPVVVKMGAPCSSQSQCAAILAKGPGTVPGICGLPALTGASPSVPSFCTTHCCTSADCPSNFFCEHGPNAGRYCVPFGSDTRGRPSGSAAAGANCTSSSECATGLCDYALPSEPTQKTCIDTCCSDSDCGGTLVCGFREGNPLEWVCRKPVGSGGPKVDCTLDGPDECKTGACYGGSEQYCTASCCNTASCVTLGLKRCVSGSTAQGTSRVNICANDTEGFSDGAPCTADANCASNICVGLKCASTCCVDADCPASQACVADGSEPRPHCAAN